MDHLLGHTAALDPQMPDAVIVAPGRSVKEIVKLRRAREILCYY